MSFRGIEVAVLPEQALTGFPGLPGPVEPAAAQAAEGQAAEGQAAGGQAAAELLYGFLHCQ